MKVGKAGRSKNVKDNLVLLKDFTYAEIMDDEAPYMVYPILTTEYQPDIGITLPWDVVLVHNYDGLDLHRTLAINDEDIVGKGMLCNGVLTGWYMEWFMSKRDS